MDDRDAERLDSNHNEEQLDDPAETWELLVAACEAGDMACAAAMADDLEAARINGLARPDEVPADVWRMGALRDFARLCRAVASTRHDSGEA
jgi:hypothetical protein